MATTPNQNSLEQDLIELLNSRRGIEEASLDDARDLANALQAQTRELRFQITEKNQLRSIGRDIVRIATQAYTIQDKELGTAKGLKDLAKQQLDLTKNINVLNSLVNQKYSSNARINQKIVNSIQDQIIVATKLKQELASIEELSGSVAKNFGVKTFGALSDISNAIPGLKRFSEPFNVAAEASRKAAVLSKEYIRNENLKLAAATKGSGLDKDRIKQLGLENVLLDRNGNAIRGSAAALKAQALINKDLKKPEQNAFIAGIKSLGPALAKAFGPMYLLLEVFNAFKGIDKAIGDTAKQLGISYESSAKLSREFNSIANESNNIFVTTKGLHESFNQINSALGTNSVLNRELLVTQTELTKQAFYSVEAATQISKLSLATGKPAKEIVTAFLGQAKALNLTNKTAINEKALLESIAKTSKATLITFAAQPGKLAEAAYQAKRVGLNLEEIKGIQDSLLNIESSIAAEFEAEVITGKQLNLERARYYALTNDIAGVARELGNQDITQAKFAKMNLLQQESIAKAMGMSRDQMAEMLIEQTAISKLAQVDGDTAKEKYDNAVKMYGIEKANAMLGEKTLIDQMASASIQDRFLQSVEKLKEIFVTLAEPLIPVVSAFANAFAYLAQMPGLLTTVSVLLAGMAARSIATAIASIFTSSALLGPIGIAAGIAGTIGMLALIKSSESAIPAGDIDSPAKGKTLISTKEGGLFSPSINDDIVVAPGASQMMRQPKTTVVNNSQSPMIDYNKLTSAFISGLKANPIEAYTYFDMNEHGRRFQKTPSGQTTRNI
jgi:hypothetical protein